MCLHTQRRAKGGLEPHALRARAVALAGTFSSIFISSSGRALCNNQRKEMCVCVATFLVKKGAEVFGLGCMVQLR